MSSYVSCAEVPPPGVSPLDVSARNQIREYLADYGEALAPLPEASWDTSVAQWMESHWDVLIDLWTIESGSSDLVLGLQVQEDGEGFRFDIGLVYVP